MKRLRSLTSKALNAIQSDLQRLSLLSELKRVDLQQSTVKQRGAIISWEGRAEVAGHNIRLQIGLDAEFPSSLPIIHLLPPDALGNIPHVSGDGFVCYVRREGLLLNRHDPVGIIQEALIRTQSTLTRGVLGKNQRDFIDEFDVYWRNLNHHQLAISLLNPGQRVREVKAFKIGDKDDVFTVFADSIAMVEAYFRRGRGAFTYENALYVPLCEESFVLPPTPDSFWNLQEIHQIVWSNLSLENEETLRQLTRKHKINETIVFSLPRPSGGHALFGISFQRIRHAHPLSHDGYAGMITPIVLERRDRDYLLPRGGAHVGLQNKHVALIGCGAVGGFVALEMGRAGILSLTLLDRETVNADNSYRHVLGREAIGKPKSQALKDEIQRKLPYAQATSIHNSVEAAIGQGKFRPARYDLIVVAIGDETTSLYLNEFFQSTPGTPPVIFTWLDPYGIGGHALLTNNRKSPGCFECLFTPVSPDLSTSLHNRASFAASGQSFAKDLSGCGTLFTPYGSIDATNTAVLATRMVIDSLLGEETGNPLLSWKGSASRFLQAGYSLSDRYYLSEVDLFDHRYSYTNPHCSVCGSPI